MADRENDLSQGLDTVAQEPSKAMDEAERSILGNTPDEHSNTSSEKDKDAA